jgi:putative transposase
VSLPSTLSRYFKFRSEFQFTSPEFTEKLLERDVKVSMNGKGRSLDNIIIERFWWSIKHENIYLNDYNNLKEIRLAIENYMLYYNQKRIYQSLNYQTPFEVYFR